MKVDLLLNTIAVCILLLGLPGCSSNPYMMIIDDIHGVLGETNAPVSVEIELDKKLLIAAEEGRLGLLGITADNENDALIPAQLEDSGKGANSYLVLMMPDGGAGLRKFRPVENESPFNELMKVSLDPNSGQVIIEEKGEMVLQYNYQTVYENDVIRIGNDNNNKIAFSNIMSGIYFEEYLKCHPEFPKDTIVSSAIYAIPRSDYIHPLYGLEGEMLTNDWPDAGHPHHRGIFWAWPEVKYGTESGDIYALQTVFARPTGNIKYTSGPVYAEIDAENLWMWEEKEAIVRERAVIRVYHSSSDNRIIDLTINLLALEDSVTIATRFTNSYGGLNLRMMTRESQEISYFKDEADSLPLRAWSDFNGIFEGAKTTSGLMVLQHQDNPDYPGDWVEYPNLAWVQPTFPSSGTRYPLNTAESLVLRYRLIVHKGGEPAKDISEKRWDAYHATPTPLYTF
ncbi:MAG: hypothetical protein E4H10_08415 [Bacteroidia bacterium]|nr:MAG: hypothetical protein E4H10_08415 [Bacteroidia bacterium]